MKIFSKFKDYYDHVQAFGQDADVSYIRNTEVYCEPYHNHLYFLRNINKWDSNTKLYKVSYDVDGREVLNHCDDSVKLINGWHGFITIYFCGKVYTAVAPYVHSTIKTEYFYDPVKYEKWFNENNHSRYDRYSLDTTLKILASNGGIDKEQLNHVTKCPIILVKSTHEGRYNIYNPRLYEVEFQRIIDPYTAYMELDMFISGVLGKTGGEMVTISDKDKIDKHGFDMKYGFRTRPKQSV